MSNTEAMLGKTPTLNQIEKLYYEFLEQNTVEPRYIFLGHDEMDALRAETGYRLLWVANWQDSRSITNRQWMLLGCKIIVTNEPGIRISHAYYPKTNTYSYC